MMNMNKLKTQKIFDIFVFKVITFFTLINLILLPLSSRLLPNKEILRNNLKVASIVFALLILPIILEGIIIFIKFFKDPNYGFGYFLSAIFIIWVVLALYIFFIEKYFNISNSYLSVIITGLIRAFVCSYFYQLFKNYSYERRKEVNLFKD